MKERKKCYGIRSFLCLLFILSSVSIFSQSSYPVHVSVQALPPYGIYLTDYYSGTRDKLIVTLLNRDKDQRTLQVKLRVQVKNGSMFSLRSRDELYYPMLTLESGIPLRLTGADIAAYLAPEKITMQGYLNQGKLPTGMTEFSVQAIDYITERTLSDYGTGRAWLETKQPPTLNLPLKDEQVAYKDPQHIRFQWMPRHQGLANTQYEFVIKQLPDNGAPPQSAFAYGQEIYRTQTRFTTLNYTHLEPLLMPGRRYAWQVRAIAKDGIDEIGMFENNGYSEINWFELNDNCPAVTQVKATDNYRKIAFEWKGTPQQRAFFVEYRPKSSRNSYDWTSVRTFDTSHIVYDLREGWTYEYRIGALCMTEKPVYSPVQEITLSLENKALVENCGVMPIVDLSNQTPKEDLKVGDVVTIGGDYRLTITQLSSQGNGWYSGKGWMHLTWIFDMNVAMKFERLRINTDYRQIDGTAESETDPKASQIANTNELDYGGKKTTAGKVEFAVKKLDFTVPEAPVAEYDPETEELIIFDTEGKPHVVEAKKNEGGSIFPMIIEDEQGNKYQVDAPSDASSPGGSGTSDKQSPVITKIEDASSGFDPAKLTTEAAFSVRFLPGSGKYAFDAGREPWYQTSQLIKDYYHPLDNGYISPWKLIPAGESDVVEAFIDGSGADKKKIKFVLKDGKGVPAREENGKWALTLPSVKSGETYEVFAVNEEKKNKTQLVGKLNVVSYAKQKQTVTLVPVKGTVPDIAWLETELNRIYSTYGTTITVKVDDALKGNSKWDLDGDSALNLNGSGFFSKETDEMKALRKLYQQASPKYDRNAYYIFLTDRAKAGEEPDADLAVQGDMPRGKQFGYIFMQNAPNTPRLIAHELGHGIFTLRHTFEVSYSGDKFKSATPNLMDYNNGSELAVWQWNVMANPAPLTWFDSEEDAKSVEDGVDAIAKLYLQYATQYKDGVYMALHGFQCNAPINTAKPQSPINSSDFSIVNYQTLNIGSKGGITAIIFRVSDSSTEAKIDSENKQLTLNDLKAEIRKEINDENNFLHFYKWGKDNFIPLKKSNDWKELKEEACKIGKDSPKDAYGKYIEHVLEKLFTAKAKNSILFVNGYVVTEELLNSAKENNKYITGNTVQDYDELNYWEGVDQMFRQRRGAERGYYANGHMSISTSNHKTIPSFLASLADTKTTPFPHLNTKPNVEGFRTRMKNGRVAGTRFVEILKKEGYAAGDTLDIVAHSMGFAYAQGIIQVIEESIRAQDLFIHLGGYYIIAPENGSTGKVNPDRWDEIWQYGTNEETAPIKKQDGVAPQCPVGNIGSLRRVYIPDTEPQDFLDSHTIVNYKWIFNKIKQKEAGYVTPRK